MTKTIRQITEDDRERYAARQRLARLRPLVSRPVAPPAFVVDDREAA